MAQPAMQPFAIPQHMQPQFANPFRGNPGVDNPFYDGLMRQQRQYAIAIEKFHEYELQASIAMQRELNR